MFNGLDELEEFAEQLAPLTPEEAASWEKRKAAAEAGRPDNGPLLENTVDIASVQEVAPQLGTIPEPVSAIVSEVDPPPSHAGSPESTTAPEREPRVMHKVEAPLPPPADERECVRESKPAPLQNTVPEIETAKQAEVLEAQPVIAPQSESAPEPEQVTEVTTRPYARYVVVVGLLVLGLAALLI